MEAQDQSQQGAGEDEEASVLEEEAAKLVDFERLYPPLGKPEILRNGYASPYSGLRQTDSDRVK